MARRKNAPDAIRVKNGLSERLRQLRTEFYGERGGPDQARTLGIPVRTWYNYENGVTVPAEIILRVVELTAVEPIWLLRGEGPKFRSNANQPGLDRRGHATEYLAASSVKDLLRVAIERLEERERSTLEFSFGAPILSLKDESGTSSDLELMLNRGDSLSEPRDFHAEERTQDPRHLTGQEIQKPLKNLRVADASMVPIVAEGAHVTYGEAEPISEAFHDKLVVAMIEGKALVRWYQHCGTFGLLKAENPATNPPSILVELDRESELQTFHRVLWISTPH
jgi:SOS-response transcriptional repressor LexA